jgi:hypothetical protein
MQKNLSLGRVIASILLVFTIVGLSLFFLPTYYKRFATFSLQNIDYEQSFHPEWEIPALSEDSDERSTLNQILGQKFSYLGSGNQTYVFESQDSKYVIKFFRFHHLKPGWFEKWMPDYRPFSLYKEKLAFSKQKRLNRIFSGHFLAYTLDKANSGIVYLQLNKHPNHLPSIQVYDQFQRVFNVDLGNTVFALQEKAVRTKEEFIRLINHGDLEGVKIRLHELFKLFVSEYERGIYDRDHNIMYNTGFIGLRPIHFDVGKLMWNEEIKNPQNFKMDLDKIAWKKIDRWFRIHYPRHRHEIAQELEKILASITPNQIENK